MVKGSLVGSRYRARETDLRCDGGERREDRERLEPVEEMRDRLLIDVEPVRHESEGDSGRFRLQGVPFEKLEIDAASTGLLGCRQAFMCPPGP